MGEIAEIVANQREFFNTDATKSIDFRVEMLKKFEHAIRDNEALILDALYEDLSKSKAEGYMTEVAMVYNEIHESLKNVGKWSRPQRVRGTLSTFPAKSYIHPEPYGVVLIMSPWNYPFDLSIAPLVAAMAAGNCAVLKCSRSSARTSKVIKQIIDSTFDPHYVCCVESDIDHDQLLVQRYDYIFFTGGVRVGRTVMRAASEHLTPVSLELGGKCPCIVDETADIKIAAKRIIWGKLLNAGQTCVSIDYIVAHRSVKDTLIAAMQDEIAHRYPCAATNDSYPKIINERHYRRLLDLIQTEEDVIGGESNDSDRKIAPAIFPHADFDHEIMKEEIFGPLIPVIEYQDIESVIGIIKQLEKPLACYVFTQNDSQANRIIQSLSFGGGCVNDAIMHFTNHHLPFGGVGNSGMGSYHGKFGFDTFSHKKGIVRNTVKIDVPARYAPFDCAKLRLLKKML